MYSRIDDESNFELLLGIREDGGEDGLSVARFGLVPVEALEGGREVGGRLLDK